MEDIFINRLPTIDLHGYDTASAKVATNDFMEVEKYLDDAYVAGLENVTIIHGIGTGLVRQAVHEVLSQNKYVSEYHTLNLNNGCTIAYLIIDNK